MYILVTTTATTSYKIKGDNTNICKTQIDVQSSNPRPIYTSPK